jgi:BirA family transcriptional regulator, biotin operon repressor / biotin---[acetyl-CoA-carboxylase] ligase
VARDLAIGSIVVAAHQTAGRGRRQERRWEAPPDSALLASFVLAPGPLLSLAAGVAAARACGHSVRLKWPNDLLLGARKLGGILVEVRDRKAIVGIGINLTWAPPGGAALGEARDSLLERLAFELATWTAAPADEVLDAWRGLSDTLGRRVRVELPSGPIEGLAEDLDSDGALIVSGRRVAAGDVIYLRARAGAAGPRPNAPG